MFYRCLREMRCTYIVLLIISFRYINDDARCSNGKILSEVQEHTVLQKTVDVLQAVIICYSGVRRYREILDDMLANPESHGGPPDCIVSMSIFVSAIG